MHFSSSPSKYTTHSPVPLPEGRQGTCPPACSSSGHGVSSFHPLQLLPALWHPLQGFQQAGPLVRGRIELVLVGPILTIQTKSTERTPVTCCGAEVLERLWGAAQSPNGHCCLYPLHPAKAAKTTPFNALPSSLPLVSALVLCHPRPCPETLQNS